MIINISDRTWQFNIEPSQTYQFVTEIEPNAMIGILALTPEESKQLEDFLEGEFNKPIPEVISPSSVNHVIDVGSHPPVRQRYPVSPVMQKAICEEVDKLLKEDIIEPSHSPWSNPIVMVRKPDGRYRFCLDFRKVNAISKKDAYPCRI